MAQELPAESAFWSSAIALAVEAAAIACFIPPLSSRTGSTESPLIASLLGVVIAVALVVHLIYLWRAAFLLGRAATLWTVIGAVFPVVGSAVALIVVGTEGNAQHWLPLQK